MTLLLGETCYLVPTQSLQIWVTLALFRLALTAIVGWLLAQRLLAQFMAAAEMLTAGTRWMR